MISEVSGVGAPQGFHVWALFANLRTRAIGPQVSAVTPVLFIPRSQSRGGGGRGARGLGYYGYYREFSN